MSFFQRGKRLAGLRAKLLTKKKLDSWPNISTGDLVMMMRRNDPDRTRTGHVLRVDRKNQRVVVEGINLRKRSIVGEVPEDSALVWKEASVHVSNVMLVDPLTEKATRIFIERDESGKRIRKSRKSGAVIPWPEVHVKDKDRTLRVGDTPFEVANEVTYKPPFDFDVSKLSEESKLKSKHKWRRAHIKKKKLAEMMRKKVPRRSKRKRPSTRPAHAATITVAQRAFSTYAAYRFG